MRRTLTAFVFALSIGLGAGSLAAAEDVEGVQEHPMIERYPGQSIAWQKIENYMPYEVAIGPVTGYRQIDDWIETEGRVTRTFYELEGEERTYSEIYLNYLEALEAQDFEILAKGISDSRRGADIGSTNWIGVAYAANPITEQGPQNSLFAGTSSSGGAGSVVARKERAAGTAYVVITVEQHSENYIGALIDIIEVEAAETGLVIVDAEAIGSDMAEYGRVVLDGIVFDFDSADLLPESNEALTNIAAYLNANPDKLFYVVGHTDSVGTFSYNYGLSGDRARAVANALKDDFGIAHERLEPHGVGPLVPVFSNESEAGRDKNRRVELVERQPGG
ncbi:MAG: OmpA family protein [Henriciella sp.]|nr:OmpA family protein [Henriciella sp.]